MIAYRLIKAAVQHCATRYISRLVLVGVISVSACIATAGCYSFRGGSAPAHLKNISIAQVEDVSGFGRATVRQDVLQELTKKFRDDNSLRVVSSESATADSRLELRITAIRTNQRIGVSNAELETAREVTIEARATVIDNVKHKELYKDKPFTGRSQYKVDQSLEGESDAIRKAIDQLTNDVLLETVASW